MENDNAFWNPSSSAFGGCSLRFFDHEFEFLITSAPADLQKTSGSNETAIYLLQIHWLKQETKTWLKQKVGRLNGHQFRWSLMKSHSLKLDVRGKMTSAMVSHTHEPHAGDGHTLPE